MSDETKYAREVSIKDYLEKRGFVTKKTGTRYLTRSPFNRDRDPSFVIYPNNSFFDWSSGRHGDIITLVRELEHCSFNKALEHLKDETYGRIEQKDWEEEEKKPFDLERFITHRPSEIRAIRDYAKSRGITEGYENGIFFTLDNREDAGKTPRGIKTWERHPSIGFIHRDKNLQTCGIKLREINPLAKPRFHARGKLGWYVLESDLPVDFRKETAYVVEGETNANSLAMHLRKNFLRAHILSPGAVSSSLGLELPEKFLKLSKKLIIDYDGNEKLYKERLKLYEHLNAEPIKLILPKGEDINSLYMAGKMYLIEHLL